MRPETNPQPAPRAARTATAIGAALVSLAAAGVATLCAALFPSRLPAPQDAQVVNVVFDSRPVVWAARLLLVSAAFVLTVGGAFIVASTVVRMRNGEWLKRAGPFEIAEEVAVDLEDQVHFWQSATRSVEDDLERLRARINQTDPIIERANADDDYDRI